MRSPYKPETVPSPYGRELTNARRETQQDGAEHTADAQDVRQNLPARQHLGGSVVFPLSTASEPAEDNQPGVVEQVADVVAAIISKISNVSAEVANGLLLASAAVGPSVTMAALRALGTSTPAEADRLIIRPGQDAVLMDAFKQIVEAVEGLPEDKAVSVIEGRSEQIKALVWGKKLEIPVIGSEFKDLHLDPGLKIKLIDDLSPPIDTPHKAAEDDAVFIRLTLPLP